MPFQLKTTGHHHHGAAMDGKPPPPTPPLPATAPPPRVSRLRRLLVRVSSSDRVPATADEKPAVAGGGEADVGSVGLDRMVLSFMEESGAAVVERPPRGRCNCFNGSNYEESDDEEDFFLPSEDSWKGKLLLGGRLILINSVLSNMVLYMTSLFQLPTGVLERLEYLRSRSFLQEDSEKRKY